MIEEKVIHAHIFNPCTAVTLGGSVKNERATCKVVYCKGSELCGLYARGECSIVGFWLGVQACPYGRSSTEKGFTRRASKFSDWIRERMETYKETLDKLKGHSKIIATVGGHMFLPYSWITMNESVPFSQRVNMSSQGNSFLPKADFTDEAICSIINFRPRATMGGEIKDYQEEMVPLFVNHLSKYYPEVHKRICDKYPEAKLISDKYSYIGRVAMLETLRPNVGELVDIHKARWIWDGTYLTSRNSRASFMLVDRFTELRLLPEPGAKVKVTHNDQVKSDTIFFS